MRVKLLVLLIVMFEGAFAQTEATIAKLESFYSRFQPEFVHGHLNKTTLNSGEPLLFKLWINSTSRSPHNLSVIVYAEILDDAKVILARQKLRVTSGTTDGVFEIPEHLPSGNYTFRAYTLWMKNIGESSFFHQPIAIGNSAMEMRQDGGQLAAEIFKVKNTAVGIEILPDTLIDGFIVAHHNGRILYSGLVLNNEKKTHAFSIEDNSGEIEIGLFDTFGKLVKELSYLPDLLPNYLTITSKQTLTPREKLDITLSLLDNKTTQNDFSIAVVKKYQGQDRISSKNFSGSVPWSRILNILQPTAFVREIYVYPTTAQSLTPIGFASRAASGQRVGSSITPEKIKEGYQLPGEVRVLPFIKLPADNTYFPDKYLELPSLEDFFQEAVPEARVKKTDGSKAIFLRNIENSNRVFFYSRSPLLLVNNKIITDQETFLAISPATIESIDFTWRTETINDTGIQTLANTGVISVFTKNKNDFGPQDIHSDFGKSVEFIVPNYDRVIKTEDKLPDFRSTQFWNPSFKINSTARLSFFLSDDLGDFTIEVTGQTDDGRLIRHSHDFRVESNK